MSRVLIGGAADLSSWGRIPRTVWFLFAAVVIAVLPAILTSSYWQTNLIVCALNVLLAIGLDFVLGYTGQLNLGQSAFYGIGAYTSTLLVMQGGVPFWMSFACGVAASSLAGVVLSLFAVRLRGHYLAIASLGFAVITYEILVNWISLTQGPLGIYGVAPPPPLEFPGLPAVKFTDLTNLFYLIGGFALLVYILLDQLLRSPIGETLTAIREDEVSAASLGVSANKWKVFAFAVSSGVAGMAGGFYAGFVGTLVPDAFNVTESISMLAMVIVGGMGTLVGPVFGAILLTMLPELLRNFGDFRLIIYGAAIALVVLFMPGGIAQGARLAFGRIRSATAAKR